MERVVFDTNAYRYLVKDLSWDKIDSFISELRLKEKKTRCSYFNEFNCCERVISSHCK